MAESEVQIKITSIAELRAFQETERALRSQIAAAKAANQPYEQLEQQLGRVKGALGRAGFGLKASSEILALAEKVPILGAAMRAANGAVGMFSAGLGLLVLALRQAKNAIGEFAQAQEKVAELDAALAQSGQLSDGYRERLQALAQQLQQTTAISEEKWLAVLTKLTQFGADSSNIDRYTEGVKNLAGVLGGDVEGAGMLFAKAMQGNFTMLTRYGIHVDEAASQTEKMDKLLQELAARGGGQLEARAQSLAGQMRGLGLAIGDVAKPLGHSLAESLHLSAVLRILTDAAAGWAQALGKPIEKLDGMVNSAKKTRQSMEETEAAAKSLTEQGLKRVADEAQRGAAALDAQQAALTRLQREQDEIANAKMAVELAEADASSDPESVKLKKKAEIRKRYAEDAYKLAQQIDRAQLDNNREAIDRQLKDSDTGHAKQAALEEDLAKAKASDAEEGSLAGKLPNVQRWREQQEKRLAEAQAAMDAARAKPGMLTPAKLIYYKGERDDAETQANAARAEEKRIHQRILQTRAGRGVGSTTDIQAELDRTKKENEKRDEQLRQDEAQKQRENAEIESRMRVREATQPDKQKAADITTNAEVAKARAAEEKAREEKVARDAEAAREEAARAEENKLREMELSGAKPDDLRAQRGRVATARLPADATPEQRRAAELAGQEPSSAADKNDFFRRANNTATQLSTAEQIQKQDIRQIGVQGGETVAGALKKAMEQMGMTLADTLSADELARAIKGSTGSIAKSYSDLLTRLKDVEDRLRKGK